MFHLYATFVDSIPMATFPSMETAEAAGKRWFVGNNWVVRTTASFDFYKV